MIITKLLRLFSELEQLFNRQRVEPLATEDGQKEITSTLHD